MKYYWLNVILFTSIILHSFYGCDQPTDFNNSQFFFQTPEEVVENLALSYEQKNLEQYLSSFTADSKFSDGPMELWGKANESRIHQTMFASAENIDLQIKELSAEATSESNKVGIYNYSLRLVLSTNEELLGQGRVELGFVKNKPSGWQISSFREMKHGLRKSSKPASEIKASNDSVDYFPLRVGNEWTYAHQISPILPDVTVTVTDSIVIRDNLYFSVERFSCPFIENSVLLRVDFLQQLKMFVPSDSSEALIYKFAASVGQTWNVKIPGIGLDVDVELSSRKDSLKVPAGTFTDVLEFLITDVSNFRYEFADNIGCIRQRGENQELILKSAYVNGKKYPLVTSVQTYHFDWMYIKKNFIR